MGLLNFMVRGKEVDELKAEIANLRDSKKRLNEEVERIKLQKRLEAEEIKHMVKINEERTKQQLENEKIRLEREMQQKITKLQDESRRLLEESLTKFHDKMESRFSQELGNLKEVYSALMQRLPKINLQLEKKL